MISNRFLSIVAACGALTVLGCQESPAPPPETTKTYYGDVKQLVDERCVNCHQPGGIAPFSLVTFAELQANLGAVRSAVDRGTMPPWPAADDCNDYKNDRSLSDEEADVIVGWIDGGAPEGDRSDEAAVDKAEEGLNRVDLSLSMPVDYTPTLEPDDYRCFLLDWPEDQTKFVTGFQVNPGNAASVHHVIAYLVPPNQVERYEALDKEDAEAGYTCFGGPGGGIDMDTRFVGSWAPGAVGGDLPAGTGIRVEPGSKISLQVHYNTLNTGPVPDRTSIDLKLDDAVEHEGTWQFFTDLQWVIGGGMELPAMTKGIEHSYDMDPTAVVSNGKPFNIHAVGLHMHTLGTGGKLSVENIDGETEECMVSIPEWDFHWQLTYELDEVYEFKPGNYLHIECEWDNPTAETVRWGEGTGDEMCLGLIYYSVP